MYCEVTKVTSSPPQSQRCGFQSPVEVGHSSSIKPVLLASPGVTGSLGAPITVNIVNKFSILSNRALGLTSLPT